MCTSSTYLIPALVCLFRFSLRLWVCINFITESQPGLSLGLQVLVRTSYTPFRSVIQKDSLGGGGGEHFLIHVCKVCVSRHKFNYDNLLLLYTIVRVIASIVLAVMLLTRVTAANNMATSIILYVYFAIVTKTIESGCLARQSPETTWHDSV